MTARHSKEDLCNKITAMHTSQLLSNHYLALATQFHGFQIPEFCLQIYFKFYLYHRTAECLTPIGQKLFQGAHWFSIAVIFIFHHPYNS